MRVLVVEDQVDLGDVFRDFLVELGHHPLVVHTAEAALASLQTERLDAILLDVQLPGMSGIDFLQLRPVRALGVPIVAVSGVVNLGGDASGIPVENPVRLAEGARCWPEYSRRSTRRCECFSLDPTRENP